MEQIYVSYAYACVRVCKFLFVCLFVRVCVCVCECVCDSHSTRPFNCLLVVIIVAYSVVYTSQTKLIRSTIFFCRQP